MNIKMPNGQLLTIPVSGELKIGLLKAAIKKGRFDRRGIRAFDVKAYDGIDDIDT